MSKEDYYEILGVNKNASDDEIKSAFRKAAKQYHPDLHPDDKAAEAKFKKINEAYEVLSDPQKRGKYDQFGHAAFDQTAGGGYSYTDFGGGFGGFSDIFETVFGSGFGASARRNTGPVAGNDLRYNLTITFEEAAFGVRREILVPREENCRTCEGSGAKPGTQPQTCGACGGSGHVRVQQNTVFGSFASMHTCDACGGTGKLVKEPCSDCKGRGRVSQTRKIIVNVPAGIDNGQTLTMPGEGEAGQRGGPSGDLYISIRVKPHKLFVRKGYDLYLEMTVSLPVAMLGGEIQVPTLGGSVKYTVPEGTQPNTTFRLRDQGITRLNSSNKGDLFIKLNIQIPKKLSDEQRTLVTKLAESMGEKTGDAKPNKRGLFEKFRESR